MPLAGCTMVQAALTPTARSAAVDVTEESYDLSAALALVGGGSGPPFVLATSDHVTVSTPVVYNTHVGVVGARVVDATHIAIQWGNFTAAANVPPAGTYRFIIQRT